MPTKTQFPGIYWGKDQIRDPNKQQDFDTDWDIYSRAEVVKISAADVTKVTKVLASKNARMTILRSGWDLRQFKNMHFSVQLAATCVAAEKELASKKVKIPSNARAAVRKEIKNLQSVQNLYQTFASNAGGSVSVLNANTKTIKNVPPEVLRKLARSRSGHRQSTTSVDSPIGQVLKWDSNALQTTVDREFVPDPAAQANGKLSKIDAVARVLNLPALPLQLPAWLQNQLVDPCACELYHYTWTEQFSRSWTYVLEVDYACGVRWCHKRVWGVRVTYPCGIRWCTADITFTFNATFLIAFEFHIECGGIIILAVGSACNTVTVAGQSLTSCIEAYAVAGAGYDVNITVGTQQGKCLYGGQLVIGLRAVIGGYTVWQGSYGYDYALELPCVNQFDPNC